MLEVKRLCKHRGKTPILKGLSLRIPMGTFTGLVGLNGAGKTTTIECIAGCLPFDAGSISIHGKELAESPLCYKQLLGYMPDQPPLYEDLSSIENIRLTADLRQVSTELFAERMFALETRFSLSSLLKKPVRKLSKGQKQLVGLCTVLIFEPQILLLDEPFQALDPHQVHQLTSELLARKQSTALLISSHTLSTIDELCDEVVLLEHGTLHPTTKSELTTYFASRSTHDSTPHAH